MDADPVGARAHALLVVGWLIERADFIRETPELAATGHDELFALIRRLRGKYGVHPTPRRERQPKAECEQCMEFAVVVTWIDDPNGSPKPVRVAKCGVCGHIYTEEES